METVRSKDGNNNDPYILKEKYVVNPFNSKDFDAEKKNRAIHNMIYSNYLSYSGGKLRRGEYNKRY